MGPGFGRLGDEREDSCFFPPPGFTALVEEAFTALVVLERGSLIGLLLGLILGLLFFNLVDNAGLVLFFSPVEDGMVFFGDVIGWGLALVVFFGAAFTPLFVASADNFLAVDDRLPGATVGANFLRLVETGREIDATAVFRTATGERGPAAVFAVPIGVPPTFFLENLGSGERGDADEIGSEFVLGIGARRPEEGCLTAVFGVNGGVVGVVGVEEVLPREEEEAVGAAARRARLRAVADDGWDEGILVPEALVRRAKDMGRSVGPRISCSVDRARPL